MFFFYIQGVNFAVNNGIARFMAKEDGKTLEQVELLDGTYLQCDVAVLGIGSTFNTEWLKETQVQLLENGSIATNGVLYLFEKEFQLNF